MELHWAPEIFVSFLVVLRNVDFFIESTLGQ